MKRRHRKPLPHSRRITDDGHYVERRGSCAFSTESRRDDTMRRVRAMGDALALLLKKAGESIPELKEGDDARVLFLTWWSKIAAKHGVLSPVALGAKYIGIAHVTMDALLDDKPLDKKMEQVFALCQAYHMFHAEVFGEHRAAFDGLVARNNLAASGLRRADKKRSRRVIVEEWCSRLWEKKPSFSDNAAQTAREILPSVNTALQGGGHPAYTAGSLEKLIRQIVHDRSALAS
jgi:hypothetical protein